MLQDIFILKQNNFNAVRLCHYPNNIRFYDLCDEYGLYLVCWSACSWPTACCKLPLISIPSRFSFVSRTVDSYSSLPAFHLSFSSPPPPPFGIFFYLMTSTAHSPPQVDEANIESHGFVPMVSRLSSDPSWEAAYVARVARMVCLFVGVWGCAMVHVGVVMVLHVVYCGSSGTCGCKAKGACGWLSCVMSHVYMCAYGCGTCGCKAVKIMVLVGGDALRNACVHVSNLYMPNLLVAMVHSCGYCTD